MQEDRAGTPEETGAVRQPGALYVQGLILAAALLFVLLGTQAELRDTANSRLATVWSLTEQGTWRIDLPPDVPPNPFEPGTIDKVRVEGRLLSSKPPVLPLLMTAEYWVLHRTVGWRLDVREDLERIIYVMTLTLVGLPYLLLLLFFAKTQALFAGVTWRGTFLLFALAFATLLTGLATDLNNHVPGAAMLVVALYFALGVGSGRLAPRPWRFFLFGLCGGLVFTLDMPLTIFVAFAGLYLLYRHPLPAVLWSGLGLLPPLLPHFAVMMATTGSPLPVQVRKELYLYQNSPWRIPGGIDALNEPKGTYLFHMTFGRHGTFLIFPVLLLGLAGVVHAVVGRGARWRGFVLAGFAAFAILTAYYVLRTNNYAGAAYGFRWHAGAMPVLLLMGVPLLHAFRRRWPWVVLALLLAVSLFSAWESYQAPWGENHEWPSRWIFR